MSAVPTTAHAAALARAALAHGGAAPSSAAARADIAHVALGIGAWGLVTGVAMVQSGLSVPLALFMSLLVFAGSAQLTALPLLVAGAPAVGGVGGARLREPALRHLQRLLAAIFHAVPAGLPVAPGLLQRRPELRAVHAPLPEPTPSPSSCPTSGAAWR